MANPSVLIIALAANELGTPRANAVLSTTREVLGPDVVIRVEAFDPHQAGHPLMRAGSGDEPRANGPGAEPASASRQGAAYAWLAWDETDPNLAHLECFIPYPARWVHRDVTFGAQDPATESGRTIGFVIASMYVGNESSPDKPSDSVRQKPTKGASVAPNVKRFVIEGAASLAASGDVASMGALASLQARLGPSVSLGVASEVRFGTVGSAQASVRFIGIGALFNYRLWPRRGAFWFGPQLFGGAEQVRFSHFSGDDPAPVNQSAWIPRADGLVTCNWELSDTSLVFLGLGANYRFGEANVFVHDIRRAHIPAWVGVGRLGIGTRF